MVLYPSLVRFAHGGSGGTLGEAAVVSFRYVLAIFVPLTAACAAMAPLIVDVAYRRGAFGADSAAATSAVAAALAPMIVLTMIEPIVVGAHNSRRRGTLLLAAGLLNVAIHTTLNVVLGLTLGVAGVALSTSITMAVVMGFLAVRLAASEPTFDLRAIADTAVRALAASLIVAIPIGLWTWSVYIPGPFLSNLALLVGLTLAGFVAYLAIAARVGLAEPAMVVGTLRRRLSLPFGSRA
jgi:putative peptidoglycan lipid II flippase